MPGSPLPTLEQALAHEITVTHLGRTLAVTAARLETESGGVVWTACGAIGPGPCARFMKAITIIAATAGIATPNIQRRDQNPARRMCLSGVSSALRT